MEIKLWKDFPVEESFTAPNSMDTYLVKTDKKLPCIVVLPGGGYENRAPHEGATIAEKFNEYGLHSVVVNYRIAPNRYPDELLDAQRAVKIVRANADEWFIDPDKIIVLGFSAGGHLSACTAFMDDVNKSPCDEIDKLSCKVNGAILCYPVISVAEDYGHVGSGMNLLGDDYEAKKNEFNMLNYVDDNAPPVFVWHTSDDSGVSIENSLRLGIELRKYNQKFEMHIFQSGFHGLGLAEDYPDIKKWFELAVDWIKRNY